MNFATDLLLWAIFYQWIRFHIDQSEDLRHNYLHFLHCFVGMWMDLNKPDDFIRVFISFYGYDLLHLVWRLQTESKHRVYILHHMASLVGTYLICQNRELIPTYVWYCQQLANSNFWLCLNYHCRKMNWKQAAKIVEIFQAIFYGYYRIVLPTQVLLFQENEALWKLDWISLGCFGMIYGLSWIWTYQLGKKVWKQIRG